MNEQSRATIRVLATRRFRAIMIALGLIFCGMLVFRYLQGRIADNASQTTLARESSVLTREYLRYEFSRGRELIPYPPPNDETQYGAWAKRISEHLGQQAAVFVSRGSAITWVTKPPLFDVAADSVQWLLIAPSAIRRRAMSEIVGETQIQHVTFVSEGGDNHSLWLLGQMGDSLRWGALVSSNDTWVSFFQQLQGSYAEDATLGSPAWALQEIFSLPRSPTRRWNMGLRAFLDDSLIFASEDLDTTRRSYTYEFSGRKAQCYQSRLQASHARWMAMSYVFWPLLLFPLVFIVPFYRFYRQIRTLTEKEKG
jgi:hypothetical protein